MGSESWWLNDAERLCKCKRNIISLHLNGYDDLQQITNFSWFFSDFSSNEGREILRLKTVIN